MIKDLFRIFIGGLSIMFLTGLCLCHLMLYGRDAAADTWRVNV